MTAFGTRLREAVLSGGRLCVGIDPHESLLREWGLPASAEGAREFGLRVVDAAAGRVGTVKPQVSFFERWGAAGYAALEDVLAAARATGLVVIADAKRGDIGTTMDAYAAAWLTPGSPLEADAMTVSPYLGVGALASTFDLALAHGKGVFVLAATSNPEAITTQIARAGGTTTAALIAEQVAERAEAEPGQDWSSLGLVIGATVDLATVQLAPVGSRVLPVLAPGFGTQGAEPGDLARVFGGFSAGVLASESRSILSAGPDGLGARIQERAALYGGA
ncbi:orotidine-5'-phosphate decarboxylase [Microbacterium sp. NPDC064584]|uniref:orotidine-5'-phosphate decarboxylase n=1 Tax=Microbacterium sp. NPDC064584 TaxID=3155817 RepID=UPI003428F6BB